MRIEYGNRTFNIRFYFVAIVLIFFTDHLFMGFFVSRDDPNDNLNILEYLTVASVFLSAFTFKYLKGFMKTWLIVCYALLLILILESYYSYHSFFIYPHVFKKIMILFVIFPVYVLFKNEKINHLKKVSILIVVIFFIHLLLLEPEVLSISSFLNTERGFTAASTYFLLLPLLFFLNRYLNNFSFRDLGLFFILLFFILFLQHRTVWMATLAAIILNILLIHKKANFKIKRSSLLALFTMPTLLLIPIISLVLSKNPEIFTTLQDRAEDIVNYQDQGTGSWRMEQFTSYWPFIEDHFLAGMRFDGFELPIQFYHESGNTIFRDNTGHHFHSFYVDALFYLGIVGLLVLIAPIIYALIKGFKKRSLTLEEITWLAFAGSGLVYGLAYTLPFFYFGILGIALSYLDYRKQYKPEKTAEDEEILAGNKTPAKLVES